MMEIIYGLGKAAWIVLVAIPGSFWGIVVGSFFSLGGVYLTNRASARRLQQQLEHDRQLKNREREMALRKEIFLDATEAISAGLIAMGQMSNLEVSHEKLTEGWLAKASSVAKVHLVASEASVRQLLHFSGEFAAAFLRLGAKRLRLARQANEITAFNSLKDTFKKEQSRIVDLMKQHNLEGSTDQRKMERLNKMAEEESRWVKEASESRDSLAAALYPEQLKFMEECEAERLRLWRLSVPVIASARKELEIPIDESEYGTLVEEAIDKQGRAIKEFGEQIRIHIDNSPTK